MKVLWRDAQQDIYKEIVDILKVLADVPGDEATDAIVGAFKVADIVGVGKDLERIGR